MIIATVNGHWSWTARTAAVGGGVVVVGHLLAVQLLGLREAGLGTADV